MPQLCEAVLSMSFRCQLSCLFYFNRQSPEQTVHSRFGILTYQETLLTAKQEGPLKEGARDFGMEDLPGNQRLRPRSSWKREIPINSIKQNASCFILLSISWGLRSII